MSDPFADMDALDREAHRWLTLLLSGEASTVDADALRLWRRQSPAHEQAFLRARKRWRDYGRAGEALLAKGARASWRSPKPVFSKPVLSRRTMIGGAAVGSMAATAAYLMIRPPLGLWPSLSEFAADYRTGTGEQRDIALANDLSIRLNTQTSLMAPSPSGDIDKFELISGEASFARLVDANRMLNVIAAGGLSKTRNGRFDVRNIDAQVCVTCVSGEVEVVLGAASAVIGPGQQLRYGAGELQAARATDIGVSTAWQDGYLVFRSTPLSDVVTEINRYRPGRVVLVNAELATNLVNGRFEIRRTAEVLQWIEQAFGVKGRVLPGGVVLLG